MTSIRDPSLFNIRHPSNRIFFRAQRWNVIYNNNPRVPTTRQPRIKLLFFVRHHLVSANSARTPHIDGFVFNRRLGYFNQPLSALNTDPGPAVAAMMSRLDAPFDLRQESGRFLWEDLSRREYVRLRGIDDVAARLCMSLKKIVVETTAEACGGDGAGSPAPVKSIKIIVTIRKRTVVDSELYDSLYDGGSDSDDDSEDEEDSGDEEVNVDEFLETVMFDVGEDDKALVCAICTDEVFSGTHVARLPCSHRFHGDCVVPWLKKKKTCPMCRFKLITQ